MLNIWEFLEREKERQRERERERERDRQRERERETDRPKEPGSEREKGQKESQYDDANFGLFLRKTCSPWQWKLRELTGLTDVWTGRANGQINEVGSEVGSHRLDG